MGDHMQIKKFDFNKRTFKKEYFDTLRFPKGYNWPVVYILEDGNFAYVGETTNFYRRMTQHLDDPEKKCLKRVYCIIDSDFNKSAIWDIEGKLITYISADGKFKMLNVSNGVLNSDYYQKIDYINKVPVIWDNLHGKGLTINSIFTIENLDIFKFSPFKTLSEDQHDISKMVYDEIDKKDRSIQFIEGNPGTGKTVLAMYFLKYLAYVYGKEKVALVVSMKSLRKSLKNVAAKVYGLSSGNVIGPSDVIKKTYDILIVDEAHRLKRRKNLSNGGEYHGFDVVNDYLGLDRTTGNQLDWIMKSSKHQILFYDANQSIKPTDIPKEQFDNLRLSRNEEHDVTIYSLEQQHRIKGGNEYISFVEDLLNNNIHRTYDWKDYSVKVFDSFNEFNNELYLQEETHKLCRMVAGYSWKWKSKKDASQIDIDIEGIEKQWNTTDVDWPNATNSINEVGCIHTIQGYDLNYAFVIFGKEIDYDFEHNEIVIDKSKYYDINGKASIKDEKELKQYIVNIYKTLMTRGILGINLYACNENFRIYLERHIRK